MTFVIERVPVPSWVRSLDAQDMELMRDATGEEIAWGVGIPMVYRALASPLAHEPVLLAPQRGEQALPAATSYWSALLNLLVYSFGWARPDRGLLWWEWAGKPTDDPRFGLLSLVWDADGMLDWFATWLYTAPRSPVLPLLAELTGYADDGEDVPRNQGWIEDQLDVWE